MPDGASKVLNRNTSSVVKIRGSVNLEKEERNALPPPLLLLLLLVVKIIIFRNFILILRLFIHTSRSVFIIVDIKIINLKSNTLEMDSRALIFDGRL